CHIQIPEARCRDALLTADNQLLVTASESSLACWSVASGSLVAQDTREQGRNFLRLVPDKQQVLTGNASTVEIRQLPGLELVRSFELRRDVDSGTNMFGDAIVRTQDHSLVTGSWNGTITVWDLETSRARVTLSAHATGVHSLVLSPDQQTLFSAGHDGNVKVWEGGER
ncbi:MAG: hypothetical protein KDA92_06565, partial [Planctomycetales bacterium]|nr:hypothetical protein [Planctomycetales bacterium]